MQENEKVKHTEIYSNIIKNTYKNTVQGDVLTKKINFGIPSKNFLTRKIIRHENEEPVVNQTHSKENQPTKNVINTTNISKKNSDYNFVKNGNAHTDYVFSSKNNKEKNHMPLDLGKLHDIYKRTSKITQTPNQSATKNNKYLENKFIPSSNDIYKDENVSQKLPRNFNDKTTRSLQ